MIDIEEIKDDELRVLGRQRSNAGPSRKKAPWWCWAILAAIVILATAAALLLLAPKMKNTQEPPVEEFYDPAPSEEPQVDNRLGDYSITGKAYTEHLTLSINDIPLDVYIPHNASPRLYIGTPSEEDKSIVFTTQAADIRADNGKINGAFVIAGEPKSWGLSKVGYCGIIDGKITVGVAKDSPLFEKATETGGYFFRQYALVDNGVLVENEPKGKSFRKAICDRDGEILVVMSSTRESFHDFAQALVDLGVDNAVYLVGSTSYGYYRDLQDQLSVIYEKRPEVQRFENHIQWVAE